MQYEKLGVFYLGQACDPTSLEPLDGQLTLYDSRDLCTHGVCVGMTGSGKTGLCIGLLEEAAIDSVPAIIIDPKGDLSNLLLTFPKLRPEDFRPWIQEDQAARKGITPDEFAAEQAELWRNGLAGAHQDASRIQRLRDAADFAIYTPGSQAGLPVSVLKSFSTPSDAVLGDADLTRERIGTSASSLLALLAIDADPVRSREHILISNILQKSWEERRDVDIAQLIRLIQDPPFERIGVMDLESFYPGKQRFELAMQLNNLMAAPGFQSWLEGEPLDVRRLLHTPEGKPRLSIFSIAHLSDPERMFFVSLLLNEVLGWMRNQPGTGSLRALVYMDEVAGYLPPTANPPSKTPLLTLFKQARAFGLGVVLSTQNPVDLDYKALSNAGTWFIGRLQTERDKNRLLDGLESARAGAALDRRRLDEMISSLDKRMFLLHNVHEEEPQVFKTRWVLSYLRGPMTRDQIKQLMRNYKGAGAAGNGASAPGAATGARSGAATASGGAGRGAKATAAAVSTRPVLPPGVPECFVPVDEPQPEGGTLVYRPMLFGAASVTYSDTRRSIDHTTRAAMLTTLEASSRDVDWDDATWVRIEPDALADEPEGEAQFEDLAADATQSKSYTRWRRELQTWLYRNRPLELWRCAELKEISKPGEGEGDFRVRLRESAREERDKRAEKLRKKYEARFERAQDRIRTAEHAVERTGDQHRDHKAQTAISFGAAILGSLLGGRKKIGRTSLGRATTAMRGVGRSQRSKAGVERAHEKLDAAKAKLADLEAAFEEEVDELSEQFDVDSMEIDSLTVKPKKKDIEVERVTLTWMPFWQDGKGALRPAAHLAEAE